LYTYVNYLSRQEKEKYGHVVISENKG